jgi:hypothetical protein
MIVDSSDPIGATQWRDVLDDYARTLEDQRAYLDAVAGGASDAEPPAPFLVPTGLSPAPDAVRTMIADLHAATLTVLAKHKDLPDRLAPAGNVILRRTTTTVSVLDRAL